MRRLIIPIILSLAACSTIPVDQRPARRAEIDTAAEAIIERITAQDPSVQAELDSAVGYLAGRLSSVSAPLVGGGSGIGVLVNNRNRTRAYVNLNRFDLSAGLGAQTYGILLIFDDKEVMDSFRQGRWQTAAGGDVAAGTAGGTGVVGRQKGFTIRALTEAGLVAGVSLRLIRVSVNHDLTDTGISEISIPNRGFDTPDGQDEGPRIWDRKLPFLAQRVVDGGYDLPLPLGTGITYVYTDQEQLLDQLEIGFDGGEKTPINFVTFDNAFSKSDTAQVKFDAWLFPFMNVFASIGRVNGRAPLEFTLDGDTALEDLIDGGVVDCEPSSTPPFTPPNPIICAALPGTSITVPIEASFTGTTYGIGTVLAGGWNGFFVTIPIVFTYADMEDTNTEGVVTAVTPRAGSVINMGRWGNLAIYGGGQYLKSELDVSGTFEFGDTGLAVDYKIRQENKDKWNGLIGGNWDINKHWSWALEYGGFVGSRENVITTVSLRF